MFSLRDHQGPTLVAFGRQAACEALREGMLLHGRGATAALTTEKEINPSASVDH